MRLPSKVQRTSKGAPLGFRIVPRRSLFPSNIWTWLGCEKTEHNNDHTHIRRFHQREKQQGSEQSWILHSAYFLEHITTSKEYVVYYRLHSTNNYETFIHSDSDMKSTYDKFIRIKLEKKNTAIQKYYTAMWKFRESNVFTKELI